MPQVTAVAVVVPSPAPLNGRMALVVGTIGGLLAAISPFIPSPWSMPATILGFLAASLAGLAANPPSVTEGRPLLQGGLLSGATAMMTLLVQFFPAIPPGWPQSVALGLAAFLAWATGRALPHLGSPSKAQLDAAKEAGAIASDEVITKPDAIAVLQK